jgi:hypothetical protein
LSRSSAPTIGRQALAGDVGNHDAEAPVVERDEVVVVAAHHFRRVHARHDVEHAGRRLVLREQVLLHLGGHFDLPQELVALGPGVLEERRARRAEPVQGHDDGQKDAGQHPVAGNLAPALERDRSEPLPERQAERDQGEQRPPALRERAVAERDQVEIAERHLAAHEAVGARDGRDRQQHEHRLDARDRTDDVADLGHLASVGLRPTPRLRRLRGPIAPRRSLAGRAVRGLAVLARP